MTKKMNRYKTCQLQQYLEIVGDVQDDGHPEEGQLGTNCSTNKGERRK